MPEFQPVDLAGVARRLDGAVAVVTGAAGGLGRAAITRLAAEGAKVVAVDLDADAAADAIAALSPDDAVAVAADVSAPEGVQRYIDAGLDAFGKVDRHFLNAGISGKPGIPVADTSEEEWDRVMGINLRGPYLGVRAAFRACTAAKSPGSIVVSSSIAGLLGSDDLLAYTASKHGVRGLVHGAAVAGGPLRIRVNAIAPGIVPTSIFGEAGLADMELRARTSPLRRAGRPEEIAAAVAFLLSDDASYITGVTLSLDGGTSVVNPGRRSGGAGLWDPAIIDQ